jgi:hypothetical protein
MAGECGTLGRGKSTVSPRPGFWRTTGLILIGIGVKILMEHMLA